LNELYLTLRTDFAPRRCFCFSANDSFYWTSSPTPLVYRNCGAFHMPSFQLCRSTVKNVKINMIWKSTLQSSPVATGGLWWA